MPWDNRILFQNWSNTYKTHGYHKFIVSNVQYKKLHDRKYMRFQMMRNRKCLCMHEEGFFRKIENDDLTVQSKCHMKRNSFSRTAFLRPRVTCGKALT